MIISVVGAGIIGLTTALTLADRGHSVTVHDPAPASGASHHAGGMLAPTAEVVYKQDPLFPLMRASAEWYPGLIALTAKYTDLPTGYRTDGTLVVARDTADKTHLSELRDYQSRHGMAVDKLTTREARKLEPALSPALAGAVAIDGDHQVQLEEGDLVVLASSLIPGNENSVYRVINDLTRLGARVVSKENAKVHVSGHASAGELIYCYNIVQPKNVMPIHGEVRHLVGNGQLAVKTGIDPQNVVLAEDGVTVDLKDGVARVSGIVPCEYVYVDGRSIGEISEDELETRRTLGSEGFISIFAVVEHDSGMVLAGPEIRAIGMAEDDSVFEEILPDVTEALSAALETGKADAYSLQQVMRRTLGRWIGRRLRRRPMIVPVVIEA